MAIADVNGIQYHIDDKLKKIWDNLRNGELIKRDDDRVYIVDGREGSGKSVFTIQQASYLDPTFSVDQIAFTPEEFINLIRTSEKGKVIIFDEAFRGLSSAASRSKVNQKIKQALMEMRQRNLIVFIVLPSFFLLDIYAAMLRSVALFHVYKNKKGKRGFWRCWNYNKKAQLYQAGLKKGWSYSKPSTRFRGKFFNKYPIDEKAYRNKKDVSLKEMDGDKVIDNTEKDYADRDFWIAKLKEVAKISIYDIEKMAADAPTPIKKSQIAEIVRKTAKKVQSESPIYNI